MLQTAEDIKQLNERIQSAAAFVDRLEAEIAKIIVGQHYMISRLLIGLLSNGHVLLEGVPGLAKTLSIKSLSQAVNAKFSRIQFTPDLLPADVIGTMIYIQLTGCIDFQNTGFIGHCFMINTNIRMHRHPGLQAFKIDILRFEGMHHALRTTRSEISSV